MRTKTWNLIKEDEIKTDGKNHRRYQKNRYITKKDENCTPIVSQKLKQSFSHRNPVNFPIVFHLSHGPSARFLSLAINDLHIPLLTVSLVTPQPSQGSFFLVYV